MSGWRIAGVLILPLIALIACTQTKLTDAPTIALEGTATPALEPMPTPTSPPTADLQATVTAEISRIMAQMQTPTPFVIEKEVRVEVVATPTPGPTPEPIIVEKEVVATPTLGPTSTPIIELVVATPTPGATPTPIIKEIIKEVIVTPTPTPTPPPTPTPTPTATPEPTATPTPTPTATPEPTATPTPTPTPTPEPTIQMELYSSARYPFSIRFPSTWSTTTAPSGVSQAYIGTEGGLLIVEEDLFAQRIGPLTLDEYVAWTVSAMKYIFSNFELQSRQPLTTAEGWPAVVVRARAGDLSASIFIYVHQNSLDFSATYYSLTGGIYNDLLPNIGFSFSSFRLKG